MLKVGEKVLYGAAGACTVMEIGRRRFGDGPEREYYVLTPVHDEKTTLYVPVDNPALEAKMRRLLSAEELEELISSMPKEEAMWISDEKKRQETYRSALKRGDRRELIGMTKALYSHRRHMASLGRKLHIADEKLFREAEKLLCDEFAAVLGIAPADVVPFLIERLEAKEA